MVQYEYCTPRHRHRHDLAAVLLAALFCAIMIASVLLVVVVMWYDLLVTITRL